MKATFKKHWGIITIIVLAVIVSAFAAVFTVNILKRNKIRDDFVFKLEQTAGSYDETTIVLNKTTKYDAEMLAKKLDARLRISQDGRFAVLYLKKGQTIIDVCRDDKYKNYVAMFTPDYMATIADADEVEQTEEMHIHAVCTPQYDVKDAYYSQQSYLNYLNLGNTWDATKGSGITVAVIDTGIDTDHPEFAGRISDWSYNATYDKIVRDYDNDWSLIEDTAGHGTSVAGVIAASMDDAGITGIAPEVNLLVIKAEGDDQGRFARISDLVFGVYYAIERDVDVINMSFYTYPDNPFEAVLQLAVDSDILCIAAAGNEGKAFNCYPAADSNCIGVGALADGGWERAGYSQYGESADIYAPGTVFTTAVGGGYRYINGTSFSSPIVASAAVLYKALGGYYEMNEVFIKKLHASSYDLGDPGPDFFYGYGAIDFHTLLCEPYGTVKYNMMSDELYDEEGIFSYGHAIQDIPEPERLYAVFDGWYYDPQFTEELNWYEDICSADFTLYAKWANEDDVIPFEYRILEDDTVEILGYRGKRRFITIPDYIEGRQVSSIGFRAFMGESRLRRIILPHYLKNIGDEAFSSCTNIISFDLPDGVKNIGEKAFADNIRLNSLTLGSSLETVGDYAFEGCGFLTSLYFPVPLREINGTAFAGTVSMTSILVDEKCSDFISVDGVLYNHSKSTLVAYPASRTSYFKIPDETKTVGIAAFYSTGSSYVDLNSVITIEDLAFMYGNVTGTVIPDTCTELGIGAYYECGSLKYANLSSALTKLETSVFSGCGSLKEIFIGKNIKSIGKSAFEETSSLITAVFEEGSELNVIDKRAFKLSGLSAIEFPKSLIHISDEAFFKCDKLSSVTFEENCELQFIGISAFESTSSLKRIELPGELKSILDYCFKDSGLRDDVKIPSSVTGYGAGIFASCRGLKNIKVDGDNAVYKDIDGVVYTINGDTLVEYPAGSRRTSYDIPDGVVDIYTAAFYGTWYIDTVYMPDSVVNVNGYAFFDCKYMTDYRLSDNLVYLGEYAFSKNMSLRSMYLPDSVRQISRCCYAEDWLLYEVVIGDNTEMTRIGFQAFAHSGLESFRVPANISSVAQYAFEGCIKLRRFTFAANSRLESISAYFFLGCNTIHEIVFEPGSALKSIQAHGFHGMTELGRVDFGDAKLENIDNYAFRMCPLLEGLDLPDTLKNIGRFAFYRCDNLKSLTVPEGLEHIGEYAFFATKGFNLYFKSELLPIYLDENWDNGIEGYYTGVSEIVESENWKYANLKNGTVSIIKYLGNEKDIDLKSFEYGSISVIGGYAFADKGLHSVIFPDSLEQIQRFAFVGNTELESIAIPENVNFIAQHAFEKTGIKSLTFKGNNVKVIEQYAFAYTRELKSVVLPGSLEKLGTYAFYTSGIETLAFGAGYHLDTVPEGCFAETKLNTVTVPYGTKVIDHNAFSHNHELKSVDLSACEDLMIMSNVFYNTGLTSVHIGANVRFIGEYSFMDLDDLTAFTVDENNPYYSAADGVLFNKAGTTLVSMPAGRTGSYMIPAKVEVLSFGAFENSHLSEITIEDGSHLVTFGYRAFYGAKNITSFTIPKGVVSIDYYAFAECDKLKTVVFEEGNRLSGIYEGTFFGCRSLENITLPDTVVEISDYAFYACESLDTFPLSKNTGVLGIYDYAFAYTGIADLELSPKIVDIGRYAFQGIAIKDLVIEPEDVRQFRIGLGAFSGCERIENVTVPFTGEEYNSSDNYWFGFIFGSDNVKYDNEFIPETLRNITVTVQTTYNRESNGRILYNFYRYCNVVSVVLPENTVFIGPETFMQFSSLKSFDYPQGISKIEHSTFRECTDLTAFDMPDDVETVGFAAFSFCSKLENLRLSNNLTTIESPPFPFIPGTFQGCAVYKIDFPASLCFLGNTAFCGCPNITEVYVADNVTVGVAVFANCASLRTADVRSAAVGDSMFAGCKSLESVYASPVTDTIGNNAFEECESLKTFTIPADIKEIGDKAFLGCKSYSYDLIFQDIERIGENAFDGSGIKSVVLPGTLSEFGNYAFRGCTALTKINLHEGITKIPISAFENCSMLHDITLPDTIAEIKNWAFGGCRRIASFTVPKSVYLIENGILSGTNLEYLCISENVEIIDSDAFNGMYIWCVENKSNLPLKINDNGYGMVTASTTVLIDKDGYHFNDKYSQIYDVTEDGFVFETTYEASYGRIALCGYLGGEEELTLPDNYKGRDYHVCEFHAPLTKHITVPESVTMLDDWAFASYALEKLTLPSTIESVGSRTFITAMNLSEIEIAEGNEHLSYEDGVLYRDTVAIFVPNDYSGVLTIRDGTTAIDGGFTDRIVLTPYATSTISHENITGLILPDSVVEIGDEAFSSCRIETVELPPNIRYIGRGAFNGSLKKINIPRCADFDTINYYAFGVNPGVKELTIPGNVKRINDNAFGDLRELETLIIEEGVEWIGDAAFGACPKLKEVRIPNSLTHLGLNNFTSDWFLNIPIEVKMLLDEDNTSFVLKDGILYSGDLQTILWISSDVKEITIPSGLSVIPADYFKNKDMLEKITVPEGVTRIDWWAFQGCKNLREIVLPESLKSIERGAFRGCSSLEHIELPSNLEYIGWLAFEGTAITSVTIPASVNRIEDDPFDTYSNTIKNIIVEEGNEHFSISDDGVFYGDKNFGGEDVLTVLHVLPYDVETVTIKNGVKRIEERRLNHLKARRLILPETLEFLNTYNIQYCKNLEYVYIPGLLTEVYNPYITDTANTFDSLFVGSNRLKEIEVSKDNPLYASYDGILYNKDLTEILYIPVCVKQTLTIPEGVTQLKPGALGYSWMGDGENNRDLLSITLPESLKYIRREAFNHNTHLLQIRIPSGVEYIEDGAFEDCINLIKVVNDSNLVFEIGSDANGGIAKNAVILEQNGETEYLTKDDWRYFEHDDYIYREYLGDPYDVDYRYVITAYLGEDDEITLPAEYNGDDVGWYCIQTGYATRAVIPDGVLKIPDKAFRGSSRLKYISIPDTIKMIGNSAFAGCGCDGVYLPPRVIEIGDYAYSGTKITEAILNDGIIKIGDGTFSGCNMLETVSLPESLRNIGNDAFSGCKKLTEIVLPPYLETIGTAAFAGTGISSINIPKYVRLINNNAFLCENLSSVTLPDRNLIIGEKVFGYDEEKYPYENHPNTELYKDENNWDGDFLYIGNHLIKYKGNDRFVFIDRDVLSMSRDAFEGCFNVECIEVGGNCIGGLTPAYLPSLKTLIVRNAPVHQINKYFYILGHWNYNTGKIEYDSNEDYINMEIFEFDIDVPSGLQRIILRDSCLIEHKNELSYIKDIQVFVEGTKADSPWDRLAPGWNNENIVTYGEKWYMAEFFDSDGKQISLECFRNTQAIRPPYLVLPKSGDTVYTHVGWDLDGDGEPDGMPASRLSDVKAYAVVETSKPAYYTAKFMDMDKKTVISQYTLEYGAEIPIPASVPDKTGYTFLRWENYEAGMKIDGDIKIYSVWKHDGDGHDYTETVIPPNCTEQGYTLHRCDICGDEYRTDFVKELWHTFGEWIIDKKPSCSEHGDRHRICEICGYREDAIVSTTGHAYESTLLKEATCTENGVMSYTCTVCGAKTQAATALLPHEYEKVIADRGYIEWLKTQFPEMVSGDDGTEYWYYTCKNCGKIQYVESVFVASAGHNHSHEFTAITGAAGAPAAVKCTLCGDVLCHEHDFEFVSEENGITTYKCKNCGEVKAEAAEYTVVFKDYDGTVLSEKTYHYGDTVIAPSNPYRAPDEEFTYTFSGWDKDIILCDGDKTYTATYTTDVNVYTVTFKNYDGTVVAVQTYHYGDSVTAPSDPSRAADETYTYVFKGWTPAVSKVIGNTIYTAEYDPVYIDYTVKFVDYNGNVISEKTYHYGDSVVSPENPTRAADNTYTYAFNGWDKDITAVNGNETYTATYRESYIDYTVIFKNYDGNVLSTKTYHFGDTVTEPAQPVRAADETYTYSFSGWDKEVKAVTENTTYTATYKATYVDYTVKFVDYNGNVISEKNYHYGDTVTVPTDPTRPADNTYTYAFDKWDKTVTVVTTNVTYTATYKATYIEYTVKFVDYNGTVLSEKTYHYGDTVITPSDPTRPADNTYTYAFSGWDKAVSSASGNMVYTATYKATYIDYMVKFVDYNGTTLSEKTYHYGDTAITPNDPTRAADNTYTYAFNGWDKEVTAVSGNATYTATYKETYIEYTVTFKNHDGNVISEKAYHYGDTVTIPNDPTRPVDNTYTYAFNGWDKEIKAATENATYTATYKATYIDYTVKFVDYDDTVLSDKTYHYGDTVTAPANPSREKDGEYTYTFSGWDKDITLCDGDKTYRATYTTDENVYTVTFKNYDGSVIAVQTYNYGNTVKAPANPERAADNTYTYTFDGWDKEIKAVTENAEYTATYKATYIDYTVKFVNYNGTVLNEKNYHYGDTVTIPNDPTRAADSTYTYAFDGWDKEVKVVTENAEYTATYKATYIDYTVKFVDYNGNVISEKAYHYGDKVTIPNDPTRPADNTYTYAFDGWDKEVKAVTGNATYTATYKATYIDYTVKFVDYDGTVLSEKTYHYGDKVTIPNDPTRPADNTYTYAFGGWDKEVKVVTENATYTATYKATYIDYTVKFVDYNGTVLSEKTYHYGDTVTVPNDPARTADNTYTYTFKGWDKEIETVSGDETYTAEYKATYIEYTVRFTDFDGDEISSLTYHYGDSVVSPENPARAADNTYTYVFNGWDKEVKAVTENTTYIATYKETYIEYTVKFVDYNGNVISEKSYHYGDTVTTPNTPVRTADNTYTYSFNGWDKEIKAVTENAAYTATYKATYIEYTVKFVDYDDTVLSEKTYHFGDTVTAPANPSREKDGEYTYTFSGWDKDITPCDGDKTYRATYTTDENVYTVTFKNYDGTVISVKTYHYGDKVNEPNAPVKASDDTNYYVFTGWDKQVSTVADNAEYTAVFKAEAHTWSKPSYEWYSDKKTVTAKRVSENDGAIEQTETVNVYITTEDPDCEKAGKTVYTAEFENTAFEAQTLEEIISANGHTFTFTGFVWTKTDNGYKVHAEYKCGVCGKTASKDATVTVRVTKPTCEDKGETVYTATVNASESYDGKSHTEEKKEKMDAEGHKWSFTGITFTETENGYTAQANYKCGVCDKTSKVSAVVTVKTNAASCEEPGEIVYTAKIDAKDSPDHEEHTDKKTVTVSQVGHTWVFEGFKWNGNEAEAEYRCGKCDSVKTEKAEVTKTETKAGCTEDGTVTYTAKVPADNSPDNTEHTDVKTEKGETAKGHTYGEPEWIWDNEKNTAKAKFKCGVCEDTKEETAEIAKTEKDGVITYTATVVSDGNTYMDVKTEYIEYTVKFVDYDGTVLSEKTYHYGDEVTVPDDPEREEDETYTYSFSGWDKEITEVKGNETYTATYEATEKQQTQFVPGDINGDGSVNNKDVVALFKYVSGGEIAVNDIALDINGDGSVNNKDVVALFKYVSGGDIQLSDKPYDPNAKVMMFAIVPKRTGVR